MDLRCDNKIKFGELFPELDCIDVKCRSNRCGAEKGTVVIHRFNVKTGQLVMTQLFSEPPHKGRQ